MATLAKTIEKRLNQLDEHMQELIKGASIAFALKVLAAGLAFGLNVVLARLLGAEGSGIFFLALTIVLIVATVGRVGMENALVRFIAANVAAEQPGKVLGVYRKALFWSFVVSVVLSMLLYVLAPWIGREIFAKPELIEPLAYMALAVVPLALLTLQAFALQGLKRIAASITVLSLFIPLVTCTISILLVPVFGIDASALGYLTASTITLLLGWQQWKSATRQWHSQRAEFSTRELLSSSMPLFAVAVMNMVILWSPLLFLGVWESSETVGIYSAASRTAMLTSFVFVAVNSIAAPKFAALYQRGEMGALGKIARNSAKLMVLFASPLLLLFLIVPEWVLAIFGEEFKKGGVALTILAIGQFVNVATGSVGILLAMSGHEVILRNIIFSCLLLGLILNTVLIPQYGLHGAAVAASMTLASQNISATYFVYRKLGINMFPNIRLWFREGIQ